jgi:small subunit ribosomal protein S6
MNRTKRLYETTFIINASIEDSQIEALITHVQEIITGNGGEINAVNRWGRRRLAYPIQKKNNGFYVNIEFLDIGTVIARLEHMYLLDENILRFLTIQVDQKAIKARQQSTAAQAAAAAPAPAPPPPAAEREPLFTDETDGEKARKGA